MIGIVMIKRVAQGGEELSVMSRGKQEARRPYSEQEDEETVRLALKGIRFGSVEITIHDSRVVQIERKEKMRIDRP